MKSWPDVSNWELKVSPDELEQLGFTRYEDETGSPWGMGWEMENENFEISIDCCLVVKVARKNPDSDYIVAYVPDKQSLETLIDWIA